MSLASKIMEKVFRRYTVQEQVICGNLDALSNSLLDLDSFAGREATTRGQIESYQGLLKSRFERRLNDIRKEYRAARGYAESTI